jgi:hypothetical protein
MKMLIHTLTMPLLFLLAACGSDIDPGRTTAEPPALKGLGIETLNNEALAGAQ